jgi:phytoene dehydrogenase-like protein
VATAPRRAGDVVAQQVITPLDMERRWGLTGGHIFHGELSLDQLVIGRPVLGWARYRTPIGGLYLCGSGTHPGVGLDGRSGWLAAKAAISESRRVVPALNRLFVRQDGSHLVCS